MERLVREVTPVRPLGAPGVRLVGWLPVALAVAAYGVADARPDLGTVLARPAFLIEVVLLAGVATLVAWLALRGAVPDLDARRGPRVLGIMAVGVVVASAFPSAPDHAVPLRSFLAQGIACGLATLGLAVVPAVALLVAVRRGAVVSPVWTGAFVGSAGAVVSYLAMRLHCPLDGGLHLGLWHGLPIAGVVAVVAGTGRRLLGGWV